MTGSITTANIDSDDLKPATRRGHVCTARSREMSSKICINDCLRYKGVCVWGGGGGAGGGGGL